jgi:hypothetical protein
LTQFEEMIMLKFLLLASAFSISAIGGAQASVAPVDTQVLPATSTLFQYQVADKDSGSGNSGSGNSGSSGDSDDNDDNDDADDDDDGDNDESGSGRRKPRIPGGSGCDDPGDVAEHAECQTN